MSLPDWIDEYVWIKLEWSGPTANNNGRIALSVRQAAARLGISINTSAKAFRDLQGKGFLHMTEEGSLGFSGAAKSPLYEITELPLPGDRQDGRKLYRNWREGHDFRAEPMRSNNPKGRNGKTKSRLKNEDVPVSKIATFPKSLSQK